jgi:hypothetical protein
MYRKYDRFVEGLPIYAVLSKSMQRPPVSQVSFCVIISDYARLTETVYRYEIYPLLFSITWFGTFFSSTNI